MHTKKSCRVKESEYHNGGMFCCYWHKYNWFSSDSAVYTTHTAISVLLLSSTAMNQQTCLDQIAHRSLLLP